MKKIYLLAATALVLTACDKNEENIAPSTVAAQITATIGDDLPTRVIDNDWTAGDKIGISATVGNVTQQYTNMEYTSTDGDGRFTGTPMYFYKDMEVTAYYPFTGREGTAPGIVSANTRAGNQTSENQPGIDFLYDGQREIVISGNTPVINFTFAHKMSRLTFMFKNGNDGADVRKITSYTIDGLVMTGTFDTTTGVCAADDVAPERLGIDLSGVTVTPGNNIPALIVFPQKPGLSAVTMILTDSEAQKYSCTLNFGADGIVGGHNYQFTITVSKTGLSVSNPTIADWKSENLSGEASSAD